MLTKHGDNQVYTLWNIKNSINSEIKIFLFFNAGFKVACYLDEEIFELSCMQKCHHQSGRLV